MMEYPWGYHDIEYEGEDGFYCLMRNGVNLLEGKEAMWCWSYENGDYAYETDNGFRHLIRNGVDLLEGKQAVFWCESYANGDYGYISWDVEAADYVARLIRNGGAHEKKE
ncbi:MAG: hypothetical protein ACK5O9_00475 [Holosporales bacterium]|jgi:hypothetical protein